MSDSAQPPATSSYYDGELYLHRPLDQVLLDHLRHGRSCTLFAPRQIGKTRLVTYTQDKLKPLIRSVSISLGDLPIEIKPAQFFRSIGSDIASGLGERPQFNEFWEKEAKTEAGRRFRSFLLDKLPQLVKSQVVIFFDEVDVTLRMGDFTDQFFKSLASVENIQSSVPPEHRIGFCLIGAVTGLRLIKNAELNGHRMASQSLSLRDFSRAELQPLAAGLTALGRSADSILDEIFEWTAGHPAQAQRIYQAALENTEADISAVASELFLNHCAESDDNLENTRLRLENNKKAHRGAERPLFDDLLNLYSRVLNREIITYSRTDPVQQELWLSGLVRYDGSDHLVFRNRIYHQIFDTEWVQNARSQRAWDLSVQTFAKTGETPDREVLAQISQFHDGGGYLTQDYTKFIRRALQHEVDSREIEAKRERLARERAEQAQAEEHLARERAEQEKTEAVLRAESNRLAREKAEQDKRATELDAERAKLAHQRVRRRLFWALAGVIFVTMVGALFSARRHIQDALAMADAQRSAAEAAKKGEEEAKKAAEEVRKQKEETQKRLVAETKLKAEAERRALAEAASARAAVAQKEEALARARAQAGQLLSLRLAELRGRPLISALDHSNMSQELLRIVLNYRNAGYPVSVEDKSTIVELVARLAQELRLDEAGAANALAFSPTGDRFAAVSTGIGSRLRVWQLRGNRPTSESVDDKSNNNNGKSLRTIAFLASTGQDSAQIVTGDQDGALSLWHLQQGTWVQSQSVGKHKGGLAILSASPEGHFLLSSGGGDILRWDTSTWSKAAKYRNPCQKDSGDHFIVSAAWSSQGDRFAVGCEDGRVAVWNAKSEEKAPRWSELVGTAGHALAFIADGTLLATASGGKQLKILMADTGYPQSAEQSSDSQILFSKGQVRALSVSSARGTVAAASDMGELGVWESVPDGSFRQKFMLPHEGSSPITALVVAPDGTSMISANAGQDRGIYLWQLGGVAPNPRPLVVDKTAVSGFSHVQPTRGLGSLLTVADNTKLWTNPPRLTERWPAEPAMPGPAAMSPNGRQGVFVDNNRSPEVVLRDIRTKSIRKKIIQQSTGFRTVEYVNNGNNVLTTDFEGNVNLSDVGGRQPAWHVQNVHIGKMQAAAWSASNLIFTGGSDGKVYIHQKNKTPKEWISMDLNPPAGITSLAAAVVEKRQAGFMTPMRECSGPILAVGTSDGNIIIFNIQNLKNMNQILTFRDACGLLTKHQGQAIDPSDSKYIAGLEVTGIFISSDGHQVLTINLSGEGLLSWTRSQRLIERFKDYSTAAFIPGTDEIVVGLGDNSGKVVKLAGSLERAIARLCRLNEGKVEKAFQRDCTELTEEQPPPVAESSRSLN